VKGPEEGWVNVLSLKKPYWKLEKGSTWKAALEVPMTTPAPFRASHEIVTWTVRLPTFVAVSRSRVSRDRQEETPG